MKYRHHKTHFAIAVSCAITSISVLLSPIAAQAVHLSQTGLGQVLIFPYYTVRTTFNNNSYTTLLSIVNASDDTKALKVRFLEGQRGAQVMDFNLFLAPRDTWTGAVASTAGGAALLTNDNSCITPLDLFTAGKKNEFSNKAYASESINSLDRSREGYIEVVEMGVVTDPLLVSYLTPTAAGAPTNCTQISILDPANPQPATKFPGTYFAAPTGGLSGRAVIVNANAGASYGIDAVALEQWSDKVQYTGIGSDGPLLGVASPAVSTVMTSAGAVTATWSNGRDAVSAALMRSAINNEYGLDAGTLSQTDWLITAPTKREHVPAGVGSAIPPFSNLGPSFTGGTCDSYTSDIRDREGHTVSPPPPVLITLPMPRPPSSGEGFCSSASIIPFQTLSSLLASQQLNFPVPYILSFATSATTIGGATTNLPGVQGPNGWLQMAFTRDPLPKLTPLSATRNGIKLLTGTHYGLPVIAFSFQNFNKAGVVSQYGIVHQAKYNTKIDP